MVRKEADVLQYRLALGRGQFLFEDTGWTDNPRWILETLNRGSGQVDCPWADVPSRQAEGTTAVAHEAWTWALALWRRGQFVALIDNDGFRRAPGREAKMLEGHVHFVQQRQR